MPEVGRHYALCEILRGKEEVEIGEMAKSTG